MGARRSGNSGSDMLPIFTTFEKRTANLNFFNESYGI
jgi:hypothetical protein